MKRILKKIALALLLTPFVLLLIAAVCYGIYALSALGGESTPHQEYLKKHSHQIDLNTPDSFNLFDSAFYQNQIFFLGEAHGPAIPQALDFALLKHLQQRVGVKYYLAEVDFSQAHFLNEYLRTGDEQLLRTVFLFWYEQNAQWGNQNFYEKVKKIRALNQTLSTQDRITFLGVDRIQDLLLTQRFLQDMLNKLPAEVSQQKPYATLHRLVLADSLQQEAFISTASKVLPQLSQTDTSFQHVALRHTLQNLVYLHDKVKRDSVMYLNLRSLRKDMHLEQEKLYGMWGFFHSVPVAVKRGVPFAYLLQSADSPYKQKTASVGVYITESESMMPTAGLPAFLSKDQKYVNSGMANQDGPLVFVEGIKDLKAVTTKNSVTLFKTDATGSPYFNSSRLAKTKVLMPNQSIDFAGENLSVTKVFPYLILIRGSQALTPLGEKVK